MKSIVEAPCIQLDSPTMFVLPASSKKGYAVRKNWLLLNFITATAHYEKSIYFKNNL